MEKLVRLVDYNLTTTTAIGRSSQPSDGRVETKTATQAALETAVLVIICFIFDSE